MSINQFTSVLRNKVYKDWLNKLDENIITSTADSLRKREQSAQKTSFYITESTVKDMYKTITGKEFPKDELSLFMREIASPITEKKTSAPVVGTTIEVNGEKAIFFKNIGFETITDRLTTVLDSYPAVEDAYIEAERNYEDTELQALRSSPEYKKLSLKEKTEREKVIIKQAKDRGTFGFYFNKGHVISLATNLTKRFKEEIKKADVLAEKERNLLIEVLDKYIDRLQKDDLATANLPNAVNQQLYASYIKSSDSYLVEIQHKTGNIVSGTASKDIVAEMRSIFSLSAKNLEELISNSPKLQQALLETPGSPSFRDLYEKEIFDTISGKKSNKKVYKQSSVLIGEKKNAIKKPKSNAATIAKAKQIRQKVKAVKSKSDSEKFKTNQLLETPIASLQNLINSQLFDTIKSNMGTGNRTDVLNYRTGRFAQSVKLEKLSESREGMITAFYSYMKNPYATFSSGGRQEYPKSRDPKLLISKSIREIAQTLVSNRLRAVNV
jgi:outer membrane protein assembly factor BamE (lipoprotein component of BamABCDE complex)